MDSFSQGTLAISMICAFLLIVGGLKIMRNRQTRGRGILMVVSALVIVMNVMIWTV